MSSELLSVEELLKAGDLELVQDGNHGGNYPKPGEFCDAGVPLITGACLEMGRVNFSGAGYISEDRAGKLRVGLAREGDVLLTHKGTMGKTAIVQNSPHRIVILNPQITLYRVSSSGRLRPLFLKYFFDSREFQEYLLRISSTSTINTLSITQQKKLDIPIPDVRRQDSIISVVGAIDDRINVLRETNATLEAIAQALFKSWFVDFDPVRAKMEGRVPDGMDEATAALFPDGLETSPLGDVPGGWKLTPLSQAFDINPTRTLRKGQVAPYLDMASVATKGHRTDSPIPREMGSGSKFRNGDTLLARITPCLENGKAAFVDCLEDGQIGWGSTEFLVLRPRGALPEYFAYLLCKHEPFLTFAIQSMVGTSGRQRIQNDALGAYLVAVPPGAIAVAFGATVIAIQQAISANHEQSQTLAALRDTLLPRLISGQLRLPEAQAELEAADAV